MASVYPHAERRAVLGQPPGEVQDARFRHAVPDGLVVLGTVAPAVLVQGLIGRHESVGGRDVDDAADPPRQARRPAAGSTAPAGAARTASVVAAAKVRSIISRMLCL